MEHWEFTHSFTTQTTLPKVWAFMTDMNNQVRMEAVIQRIELDGPFADGTVGRTIMKTGEVQEWVLGEVAEQRSFVITGLTSEGDMSLSFRWKFAEEGGGTQLTQHIQAKGPDLAPFMDTFRGMEAHVPTRLAQLAEELDQLRDL